jgi:hypothetical protein
LQATTILPIDMALSVQIKLYQQFHNKFDQNYAIFDYVMLQHLVTHQWGFSQKNKLASPVPLLSSFQHIFFAEREKYMWRNLESESERVSRQYENPVILAIVGEAHFNSFIQKINAT